MILIFVVNYFWKNNVLKYAENELFLKKNLKKSVISKYSGVWGFFFKFARRVWNYLYFNSKKMHSKPLVSSNIWFFAFLSPKIVK